MDKETPVPKKLRQHRDASRPEFWDVRIEEGVMPWDSGVVHQQLAHWIGEQSSIGRVLIPGCGSAYEAVAFADAGATVTAIDFSARAVAIAREQVGDAPVELIEDDVFTCTDLPDAVDVIYERAFLAALPHALRPAYGDWMRRHVRPGGQLLGYFVLGEQGGGPPFAIPQLELNALLTSGFDCVLSQPATDSLAVFGGQEHWQIWRRRDE
ncbi:TPMT family class I SAM-dependent methyltransferase [Aestuariirhabdus sp. Z084]|uniref:methyltransferase domain-containing protein n=1 Tax=Aestuariirhabdus haliotis TaxID=2918751 RepID=UPI00201B41B0|nr:methyltransferase domain-containing protein [Aestuariirhabdus haliotis]MCL6417533.1 TPMT family class I SAM-dependent methyltransferase [Aestuariirhabdus haliotis]MCL6421476.1 TPMT family class I SAM-dependent methyltransferase [Aestuariirhabdus haliotis]